jgi:hypothetical protein
LADHANARLTIIKAIIDPFERLCAKNAARVVEADAAIAFIPQVLRRIPREPHRDEYTLNA